MRKLAFVCLVALVGSCLLVAQDHDRDKDKDRDKGEGKNRTIATQVITDVIGKGDFEAGQRFFNPESTTHFGGKELSLRAAIEEAQSWRRLAPDFRMEVNGVEAKGDHVTVHWTADGTNTGTGEGIPKPTGKHIKTHGSSTFRFANGKIAESWLNWNENEVRRQLLGDRDDKHDRDDKRRK